MIKSNFHTHTIYCDGADAPEEIVKAAIDKGFSAIGFSGHSFFFKDKDYCMLKDTSAYISDINRIREKYKDRIRVFCGVEQDYYSETNIGIYDYVIGSVHNVFKDGEYLAVDASLDQLKTNMDKFYGGDFDAFAEDYFNLVSGVAEKTGADIIGHFDLILKYSEELGYSPTARFLSAAEKAVKKLLKSGKPFEINTGAMARGKRSIPYPIPEILEVIKSGGGKIVISSDCHNKDFLDYGFCDAERLAKEIGFTEHGIITENGIKYIPF